MLLVTPTPEFLDSTRLLLDLQLSSEIAQSLSSCLEPDQLARQVTNGLVEKFGCAFARIWLVEPDRTALRLVASSGIYTRIDGFFSRVPMGAFKVGKIAQNGIPFLSNHLAEEVWVKDREWAIAHGIRGFAGYPLAVAGKVVGVLAVFSQQPMAPEFLEVLQGLCTTVTVALLSALQYQQEKQSWYTPKPSINYAPLSEQLAGILGNVRLILVGTERYLMTSLTCLFLRVTETLNQLECVYCRLTYGTEQVALEAMVSSPVLITQEQSDRIVSAFGDLLIAASCLGGTLKIHTGVNQKIVQVLLTVPYPSCILGPRLHIHCRLPLLQMAFTHLAQLAGLTVCTTIDAKTPLLTDDVTLVQTSSPVLWIATNSQTTPRSVQAKVDLSISPAQLGEAVEAVTRGELWGIGLNLEEQQSPSEREREILTLLAQGLRDRDIASQLHISERTVKFHINNILAKLKARTRYQALYQSIQKGWLNLDLGVDAISQS